MRKEVFPSIGTIFILFLIALRTSPVLAQSVRFDLRPYRTPVSPGRLHEDAVFLKEVVEFIARESSLSPVVPRGEAGFESFDVKTDRMKNLKSDGSIRIDAKGRPVFSVTPTIEIRGESYKQITRAYLDWRKAFELEWIRTARNATAELKPTPLQVLFDHPDLPRSEKVRQTVLFYRRANLPRIPQPTPNPAYWPVSSILDIPEVDVRVQFNLRGGQVTVLDSESGKVWILPFPTQMDPKLWIAEYRKQVRKAGKEAAAEQLRQEVLRWGLSDDTGLPPAPVDSAPKEDPAIPSYSGSR